MTIVETLIIGEEYGLLEIFNLEIKSGDEFMTGLPEYKGTIELLDEEMKKD
jgi:hypothetical protein